MKLKKVLLDRVLVKWKADLLDAVALLVHDGDVDAGLEGPELASFERVRKSPEVILLKEKDLFSDLLRDLNPR